MRYTIDEIRQMPEGQTFDCKSILVDPKALAVIIVAMANADGGMVAVGISDKTRRVEGIDQDKAHLNEILRTPFDFCIPTVSVTTEFMACTDCDGNDNHILIFHVPASIHLHTNQADEAFWRVGDKSRKLTFEERLQLMYDKGERYYEDTAAYGATLDDVDMNAVEAYAKRIGYGKLPGIVRTDNIRHTHFSRNPKIAEFLKAYNYVKEFGEGVDRMFNELTASGVQAPQYQLVAFLIKATVWIKVLEDDGQENIPEGQENTLEGHENTEEKGHEKGHENSPEGQDKETSKNEHDTNIDNAQIEQEKGIKKGIKKGVKKGIKKQDKVLALISENSDITIPELAKLCNATDKSIRNILEELKRGNKITRIGPTNGGRWEIIGQED